MELLIGATIASALLNWLAVARGIKRLEYLTKPAVMLVLLTGLLLIGGFSGQLIWFALALVFSLVGDIFLMLPRQQFIAGLIAFLFAHLSYTLGFNPTLPPVNLASLFLAAVVLFNAVQIVLALRRGMVRSNQMRMFWPVLIYSLVITTMVFSAFSTLVRPEWEPLPAWLVSVGALLFYLSDTLLAWERFVSGLRFGPLAVIVCYHLGQLALVIGVLIHYAPA